MRLVLFLTRAQRRMLLAGTALATTLMTVAPTPASAQVAVFRPASPFPVTVTNHQDCIFPGTCALINTILPFGSIKLTNTGDFAVAGLGASAIFTNTIAPFSPITIKNSGDIATVGLGAVGIWANTTVAATSSPVTIINSGDIATAGIDAFGIYAYTGLSNSDVNITNSGGIATSARNADGIHATTIDRNSDLSITNSGDLSTQGREAEGIFATTHGRNGDLSVTNSGNIKTRGGFAEGIDVFTFGNNSQIRAINSGDVDTSGFLSTGIYAATVGSNSPITIHNSGRVHVTGASGYGIVAATTAPNSPVNIENSGDVYGSTAGISAGSNTSTNIINSGSISAGSGLAIDTVGGAGSTISNAGLITGFVDLTGQRDKFTNEDGGEFDAMKTSDFGAGNDTFINEFGGTVHAANVSGQETRFVNLETFTNKGLISMLNGSSTDVFRIANTLGGKDLTFSGSGHSTLAVDATLKGPGSTADHFIVDGSTTGRTELQVVNIHSSSARYTPVPVPVIFVEGKNVDKNNFYLTKPVDAGFFDYDLFFRPTGSGVFELKNHAGGGSHLLPELVTLTHDAFHNSTETWFDQSTDLRVMLAQGATCSDPNRPQTDARCQELYRFTPGVWARGSGSWFDLQDSGVTYAHGRTYNYNLDRELGIGLFESGIDFGKRDLFSQGDVLVVGVLGGAVEASLDYKAIDRGFNLGGGEVGAYASYLKGGLFVDTLFKTFFGQVDPKQVRGFPDTLDNTTYGIRTDAGYRFGGVRYGPFIEPLATIAASWSQVEDFVLDGNVVNLGDDDDVRGRLGLRLGSSSNIWNGTTFEPFVIGSLWGTLSDAHHAYLISNGRRYDFYDTPEDVWGVVSGGVNFFNPAAQTAVFAKVDYTFADQTQGVGVRAGMRYNW